MNSEMTLHPGIVLEAELKWFQSVLEARIEQYFHHKGEVDSPLRIVPPVIDERDQSFYAKLVTHYELCSEERLVLMLAFAPDVKPEVLDIFFSRNQNFDRGFTEFGGITGLRHGGFIPTVETAYFLLSGGSIPLRLDYSSLFEKHHVFRQFHILDLDIKDGAEPLSSTPLRLSEDILDMLILGYLRDPDMSIDFPAKKLYTNLEWDEIVFAPQTLDQLKELRAWLDHEQELMDAWKFRKYIKPGYRCLFYGPPGTGKTLTASLLGKLADRPVYRIDLSQLVSKYIGETEKNLEKIFTQAEKRNWILFFDEADSLFGKRTSISDSHDRYANQGTAYLLQRIEDCPNVVILASNYKSNIDEAFSRRFQSIVNFPMPQKRERLKLWKQGFSPVSTLESKIDLDKIAEQYEMAGGAIMNVIRFVSLMAIKKGVREIAVEDLLAGIQREFSKEGRTV